MISEEHLQLLTVQHTRESPTLQLGRTLAFLEQEEITLLSQKDPLYPSAFLSLPKPPTLIYVKGRIPSNLCNSITIVGTRNASHYGTGQAFQIANELAAFDIPIISGLARGIDTAAHKGALKSGTTIAIIASGFCNLYPKENQSLAEQITKQGAVLSEYSPFMAPTRYTFIQRNRLLAALGRATLLIESPEKGGSMVTMEMAKRLQRPLFALPATVDMLSFKGNFKLIKEGSAHLLESAEDLLPHDVGNQKKHSLKPTSFSLLPDEKKVYDFITEREKGIEELLLLTQYPIMQLNALLTSLLLQGVIEELSGKLYKKVRSSIA